MVNQGASSPLHSLSIIAFFLLHTWNLHRPAPCSLHSRRGGWSDLFYTVRRSASPLRGHTPRLCIYDPPLGQFKRGISSIIIFTKEHPKSQYHCMNASSHTPGNLKLHSRENYIFPQRNVLSIYLGLPMGSI